MDAIKVLTADHDLVRELFSQFRVDTFPDIRQRLSSERLDAFGAQLVAAKS